MAWIGRIRVTQDGGASRSELTVPAGGRLLGALRHGA
jgi:hypothetical protein